MRVEQFKDHPLYFTQTMFLERNHWCDWFIVNDDWYAVIVIEEEEYPVRAITYGPDRYNVMFAGPRGTRDIILPYDEEFKLIVYSRLETEL